MKYIVIVIGFLAVCFIVLMAIVRKAQRVCGTCAAFIRGPGDQEHCGILSEANGTPSGHIAERDCLKTRSELRGCRWWAARKVTQYEK